MIVLEISGAAKDYRGLRPLRIERLAVEAGEQIALLGFDAPTAEVFVNLATGTALPDAGAVAVFGRATSAIADSDDWLRFVDRFGIVSERAVLLEQLTPIQNLAMPFTLDVEPPPDDIRARAERLAGEVGVAEADRRLPVARLDAAVRLRLRLGRALALDPELLLLEHPSATLTPDAARAFASDLRAISARRGLATIALTADESFARAMSARVLTLDPATGRLAEPARRRWFRRLG